MSLIEQPQPNLPVYATDFLYLAKGRDRQPGDPAYNPAFPLKDWEGSGDLLSFSAQTGLFTAMSVPTEQSGVNFLPAAYPAYEIAPTVAMSGTDPVDPAYLSSLSDLFELMKELNGTAPGDDGRNKINYGTESRAVWTFTTGAGKRVNAGGLLLMKNARGVGHPGHWESTQESIEWASDPDPATPGNIVNLGLPVRALKENEKLAPPEATVLGPLYTKIIRTDLAVEPAGGGLTPLQAHTLDAVNQKLDQLLAYQRSIMLRLGIPL